MAPRPSGSGTPTSPLRVAVVVNSTTDGGGEVFLRDLYLRLRAENVDGHLIGNIPHWDEAGLAHTPVDVGPKWSRRTAVRSASTIVDNRRKLLGAASASGLFAAFHLQYKREQILLSSRLSRLAPVLWTEHGPFPRGRFTPLLARSYRAASRHVSAIVCVSSIVRDDLQERADINPQKLIVIENGIDTSHYRPPSADDRASARADFLQPGTTHLITAMSRLHPYKRIDMAINAIRSRGETTLVVAGDGPDRARLQAMAKADNLPVLFTGHIATAKEKVRLFAGTDAFVLASGRDAREGLPITLLEALSAGVPSIVMDDSGLLDVLAGSGVLVSSPDPASLARTIGSAISSRPNPCTTDWIAKRDISFCADRYHNVLLDLVGVASPAP